MRAPRRRNGKERSSPKTSSGTISEYRGVYALSRNGVDGQTISRHDPLPILDMEAWLDLYPYVRVLPRRRRRAPSHGKQSLKRSVRMGESYKEWSREQLIAEIQHLKEQRRILDTIWAESSRIHRGLERRQQQSEARLSRECGELQRENDRLRYS